MALRSLWHGVCTYAYMVLWSRSSSVSGLYYSTVLVLEPGVAVAVSPEGRGDVVGGTVIILYYNCSCEITSSVNMS